MKILILISMIALGVASCASTPPLSVSAEVRSSSLTDDAMFRQLTGAIGPSPLRMLDGEYYPDAQNREIVKIEVLPWDDNQVARFERWHIQHDQGEIGCFLVKLPLDIWGPHVSVRHDGNCKSTGY